MAKKTRLMVQMETALRAAGHEPAATLREVRAILASYRELVWRAGLEDQRGLRSEELAQGRALLAEWLGGERHCALPPKQGYGEAAEILRRTLEAVAAYPENGALYRTILENAYFSAQRMCDSALWPTLHIERTTYYQRKQEAVALFASLLTA